MAQVKILLSSGIMLSFHRLKRVISKLSSTHLFNEGGFCLPISPFSGGSFSLVNNPDTAGHPPGTELDALGSQ